MSSSSSSGLGFNSPYNAHSPRWLARPKLCKHGLASLRTLHTSLNPERRFYCCSRRGSSEDCDLWEWVDLELTDHYKECIKKLKLQIVRAKEQLDQATMAGTLNRERLEFRLNKFNSAVVKLDLLKAKNEELEGIIDGQFVKLKMTK